MGVTTYWWGSVEVEPPITAETADLLERLCNHEVELDGAPERRKRLGCRS